MTSLDARCINDAFESETMRQQRAFAAANRSRIDAEWNAIPDHKTAVQHSREHLARMTPERRAELEWK